MDMLHPDPKTPEQKRNRLKFGVASLLYNGDERAFSPLHTALVRALGGGDLHLGFMGAVLSMGAIFSWIGTLILKAAKMHRRALNCALFAASIVQGLIVGTLLLGHAKPALSAVLLVAYIALVAGMAMLNSAQQNIAVSWIGDLVPTRQRGWFVSGMAMVSNIGLVFLQLLFARLARNAGLPGYAFLVGIVMINTLLACLLVSTITDRQAKAVNFLSTRHGERVNYAFKPLWGMIWFGVPGAAGGSPWRRLPPLICWIISGCGWTVLF